MNEQPENKFVGHICRLRNGYVTDGPVEYVQNDHYGLRASVNGYDTSWTVDGSYSGLASEHFLDIVAIVEKPPAVHPMCAAMASSAFVPLTHEQAKPVNNDALLAELEHKLSIHPMCRAMAEADACTCPVLDGIPVTGSSCPVHGSETYEWAELDNGDSPNCGSVKPVERVELPQFPPGTRDPPESKKQV